MATRKPIPREVKDAVYYRDDGHCYYCGCRVSSFNVHIDHMEPLSQGGADAMHNLALACAGCNRSKGARTPIEYAEELRYRPWRKLDEALCALYAVPNFAPEEIPLHAELAIAIRALQDKIHDELFAKFPGAERRIAQWRRDNGVDEHGDPLDDAEPAVH